MRWIGIALICAAACAGSSKDPEPEKPVEPVKPAEPSAEEKLQKAQLSACAAMCERLTDCAVEDARKNLSAEEIAELNLDQVGPEHTRRCDEGCNRSSLSGRQILVIRECVNGPAECSPFKDCLDRAKPGAS